MAKITGTLGSDLLTGTIADDTILGLAGDDTLIGGTGNDTLQGGDGSDIYQFGIGSGQDVLIEQDGTTTAGVVDVLQLDSGLAAADITLIAAPSAAAAVATAVSYSTNFTTIENPISEAGTWHHSPNNWKTVSTIAGGHAIGSVSTGGTDDSYAYLSGFGPTQSEQATLWFDGTFNRASDFGEFELLLRMSDSTTTASGYEINLATDGSYCQIVKWLGPFGSYSLIGGDGNVTVPPGTMPPATGDVFKVTISGNVITAYLNKNDGQGDRIIGQATDPDNLYPTGQPGFGFFSVGTPTTRFGFSSYSASATTALTGAGSPTGPGISGPDLMVGIRDATGAVTDTIRLTGQLAATGPRLEQLRFGDGTVAALPTGYAGGTAGNDVIHGTAGADLMAGGAGNDTYIVNNPGDVVSEVAGEGTDTVLASSNFTLYANSEVEVVRANAGAVGLSLAGNELNNSLIGNGGNDTLTGGAGNDVLNGAAGIDAMRGGTGNDTYFVDNSSDTVTENAGDGIDAIKASVSYSLATAAEANSEVEVLRANTSAGVTLTGNRFTHTIIGGIGNDNLTGGIGNDTLNGGTGADTMAGGVGNDGYFVDSPGDVVNESAGGGTDTVWASVSYGLAAGSEIEFLRASAGTAGLSLTGNAGANHLIGAAGNDTLEGGGGTDVLAGSGGNDVFRFLPGFGGDTITDFTAHAGAPGNRDLMDVSSLGITATSFIASVKIAAVGAATVVTFAGRSDSIRLLNITPSSISVDDFRLA